MKRILYTAAALLMIAACCNVPSVTRVSGTLPEDVEDIFVSVKDSTFSVHANAESHSFEFDVPTDLTAFTAVSLSEDGDKFWFVADGTKLSVDFTQPEAKFVSAKPGKSIQERLNAFNKWSEEFMTKYMEASRSGKLTPELDDQYTKEYVDNMSSTVENNADNVLGIYALSGLVGQVDDDVLSGLLEKLSPVFDEDGTVQALKVKLSDFVGKGKYILVDFWASWCGPCKREIPNIKAAYDKYHGDKFDVLSVAVWDKPEDTAKAAAEHGVVWNQIVNAQRIPTDIYGIEGIPHLILFAPNGTIVKRGEGLRGEGLEETLSALLAE